MNRIIIPGETQIQERYGNHYISGYAARFFDPNDRQGTEYHLFLDAWERFAPGAFNPNQAKPVECRWNHSADFVLGTTENGTLELRTDDKGLWYDQRYNPADPDHAKVKAKIEANLCRGSSIGFMVVRAEWKREGNRDIYLVKETELRDVSPCYQPAYTSSSALFRSSNDDMQRLKAEYETWRRFERFKSL